MAIHNPSRKNIPRPGFVPSSHCLILFTFTLKRTNSITPIFMRTVRHQRILSILADSGQSVAQDLCNELGVSAMTLRRDLEELEGKGLLRRVHGGAVLASETDPGYWLRHRQSPDQKRSIGQIAAQKVAPQMTVFIDSGTTTVEVARALASRGMKEGLRASVVTHSLSVALELTSAPSIRTHIIGGTVSSETLATYGPKAVAELARLNIDIGFLGVTGIDLEAGFTNTSPVGLEVKQALIRRVRPCWVVADSAKWGKASLLPICGLAEVQGWITDHRLPAADRKRLQRAGLELVLDGRG